MAQERWLRLEIDHLEVTESTFVNLQEMVRSSPRGPKCRDSDMCITTLSPAMHRWGNAWNQIFPTLEKSLLRVPVTKSLYISTIPAALGIARVILFLA